MSLIHLPFAYIDSSDGCHTHVIGHSGFVLVDGYSVMQLKTKKMRKVAKDSTAAELVALSNSFQQVTLHMNS